MIVKELKEFVKNLPDEAEIEVLESDEIVDLCCGAGIDRLEYYLTSNSVSGRVFIRLE